MNFDNTTITNELKMQFETEFFKKLEDGLKDLTTDSTFLGIVVSNEDPDFLGRCKVRVFGLFDNLSIDAIPFAIPEISNIHAGEGKNGSFEYPKLNSIVKVRFENNSIYSPIYSNVFQPSENMIAEVKDSYVNAHVLLWDDEENIKIIYTQNGGMLIFKQESIIQIDKDNNITCKTSDGASTVYLEVGGKITITADSEFKVDCSRNQIGKTGSHPVMKADMAHKILKQLATIIDAKMPVNPAASTLIGAAEQLYSSNQVDVGD